MKPTYEDLEQQVADLQGVLEDKRWLTKEIAIIIAGPDAPENPSLADVLRMIKEIQKQTERLVLELMRLKIAMSDAGIEK